MKNIKAYFLGIFASAGLILKTCMAEDKALLKIAAEDGKGLSKEAKVSTSSHELIADKKGLSVTKSSRIEKAWDAFDKLFNYIPEPETYKTEFKIMVSEIIDKKNKEKLTADFNSEFAPKNVSWDTICQLIGNNQLENYTINPNFKLYLFMKYSNTFFEYAGCKIISKKNCDTATVNNIKAIAIKRKLTSQSMLMKVINDCDKIKKR